MSQKSLYLTFLTGLKISLFSQILLPRSRLPTIYRLLIHNSMFLGMTNKPRASLLIF